MKLEDSSQLALRSRSRKPKNNELPQEWLEGGAWRKIVIPTLFRWASIQLNPWIIPDTKIVEALETICRATFGDSEFLDVEYALNTKSTAVRLVCTPSLPDSN